MVDISMTYLGLKLRSPVIVGSCNLSDSVEKIVALDKAGAGAVVLKSLFEEEIEQQYEQLAGQAGTHAFDFEGAEYLNFFVKESHIDRYLSLISEAKKKVSIPVIASINCTSDGKWTEFAKKIEQAGADALEINLFIIPVNNVQTGEQIEEVYFKIISSLVKHSSIPIVLKLGIYFSGLANMLTRFSRTGISGLVLFNRFHQPDIDLKQMKLTVASVLSNPSEYGLALRWVGTAFGKVRCDIAASGGFHTSDSVIKAVTVGASAVQLVSAIYKNGNDYITKINNDIKAWIAKNNYHSLNELKGILSKKNIDAPELYERAQFIKHYYTF